MDWARRIRRQHIEKIRAIQQRMQKSAPVAQDLSTAQWGLKTKMFSVHIPKTGGTTFQTVLENHFGTGLIRDYGLPRDEVNRLVGGLANYCVHGHYIADKYADVPDATFVTWLRDPIDRLISQYNFWHNYRYPSDPTWRRFFYDRLDFLSFARLKTIVNMQSTYVGERAIEDYDFVGVTELFGEGMSLFRDRFGMGFDLSNLPRLRDSAQFRTVFDRSMLTRRDAAIVQETHSADFDLYRRGLSAFRSACIKTYASAHLPVETEKPSYARLSWGETPLPPETARSAMANRTVISRRVANAGISMIRGTYYYGDCWPVNLWDTFRPEIADRLLKSIADNGYNTVILLIPSGLELVRRKKPELYQAFLNDLRFLIDRIHASGLQYAYRIAYGWEGYPIVQDRRMHVFSLISGGEVQDNYLKILAELWEMVKDDPKFLMAFTTWEDLISPPINIATRAAPDRKLMMAKEIGYTGSPKGIPSLKDPEMFGYLEHVDDAYVAFMYRIKEVFPPITLEVRVDHTPTYDANGTLHPYIHYKQMVEIDTDVLGTYFGTYMMIGPTPRTAEQGLEGMDRAHHHVRASAPKSRVFVDQFNFVMREKMFKQFQPFELPELKRFLDASVDWFDHRTIGYATWSFVDYMMDITSNATFRLGLEGWQTTGAVTFTETDGARVVTMAAGSTIAASNIKHYSPWPTDGWMVIEADLDPGATLTVTLSPELQVILTAADFAADRMGVLPRLVRAFDGKTTGFALSISGGAARVARASLGSDLCSNGGLDVHLAENEISQLVAEFNARIKEKVNDQH